MIDVFGTSPDAEYPLTVPIVPTLGNNDIYPHNIMQAGPSELTKEYVELWKPFIPEDQYHIFHKGAYFWQQVIAGSNGKMGPSSEGGLVVFSLNTLYVCVDCLARLGGYLLIRFQVLLQFQHRCGRLRHALGARVRPDGMVECAARLHEATGDEGHHYWPCAARLDRCQDELGRIVSFAIPHH